MLMLVLTVGWNAPSLPLLPLFICARAVSATNARTIKPEKPGRSFMRRRLGPQATRARQKFSL